MVQKVFGSHLRLRRWEYEIMMKNDDAIKKGFAWLVKHNIYRRWKNAIKKMKLPLILLAFFLTAITFTIAVLKVTKFWRILSMKKSENLTKFKSLKVQIFGFWSRWVVCIKSEKSIIFSLVLLKSDEDLQMMMALIIVLKCFLPTTADQGQVQLQLSSASW